MHKISTGEFRGRKLTAIGKAPIRPPLDKIKQAVCNIFTPLTGLRVLDLYAGSGSLGLETLSRGAAHVTFIENHRESLKVLRQNIDLLNVADRCEVMEASVYDLPSLLQTPFDLVLIDPPYALYDSEESKAALATTLDALKRNQMLSSPVRGAMESPCGKWQTMVFTECAIRDVRHYGKTDLLLLE